MADQQTINVYDQKVEAYLDMVKEQAQDPALKRFSDHLKKNDRILDLGCGPAISSKVFIDAGFEVDPVDASEQMVIAANKMFGVGARQARFDDITVSDHYHGIWANFSLLHCTRRDFPVVLGGLTKALKQNGVLHIGLKLGEGEKRDSIGRFYSYYSEDELKGFLEKEGLSILDIQFGEEPGLAGPSEPWILILSRKEIL